MSHALLHPSCVSGFISFPQDMHHRCAFSAVFCMLPVILSCRLRETSRIAQRGGSVQPQRRRMYNNLKRSEKDSGSQAAAGRTKGAAA